MLTKYPSACMYLFSLQERSAADIFASMPFNDVSPAKRIIEAEHLAIAIMLLAN